MEEFEQRLLIQQEMVCFLYFVAKFNLISVTNQKENFHPFSVWMSPHKTWVKSLTEFYVKIFTIAVQNNSRL